MACLIRKWQKKQERQIIWRSCEAVDKVDSLSQKCKHFFKGVQAAARIIWPKGQMPHSRPEQSFFRGRSVKKMCRWHIFCVGRATMLPGSGPSPRKKQIDLILSSADDGTLRGSCTKSEAVPLF